MSLGRPRRLLIIGLFSVLLSACAGGPAGTRAAAAEGAGAGPTGLGTALPGGPTRVPDERRDVEIALVFGSPLSLARSFERIAASANLKGEEARLLAWIGARMAVIAYPDTASSFVPADLRLQSEIPASPMARLVVEALAGRAADPSPELAGQPLAELLPALAVFRSDSRETARRALAALDRFSLLGAPSVLPSLIRGLDAERRLAWTEALEHYASTRYLAPEAWPASLGSARALLALHRPEEARALLAVLSPETLALPPFIKPLAQAFYETGAFTEAEPLLAAALRADPLDSRLVLMRAHLLVLTRSYQQALPLLDAYGTVDPSNRLFLLLRALAAEGLRIREEALRWARKGLSMYPEDPELLVLAARLLFSAPATIAGGQAGAKEEARTLAREAFRLSAPDQPLLEGFSPAQLAWRDQAGFEAARLLLEDAAARYEWREAAPYLERARKSAGFDNRALASLVLRKTGDWPAALELASAWYKERPDSEAAAESYLRALVGMKDEKAALELLPRLLAGPGSPSFRSSLHYVQSLLQKSEEAALSSLRSALVENADNAEALGAMYDLYFRRKDLQRARFYLKQALALAPGDPEIQRRSRELEASSP